MKIKCGLTAAVVVCLVVAPGLFAQIDFNAQLITPDIKSFFIRDLVNSDASIEIFRVHIHNTSFTRQTCRIYLRIEKGADRELLATGSTNPFDILPVGQFPAPGENAISTPTDITNRDLFSSLESLFSLSGGVDITGAGQELQNQILASGRLPSDIYFFTIGIESDATVSPMPEQELQLDLRTTGSVNVTLLGPGSDNFNPVEEIDTIFPLFSWDSGLTKFRLIVAERLETVPGLSELDPLEVLNTRTVFDITLQKPDAGGSVDAGATPILSNSYQYTGGLLQYGRTYYYQVIGLQSSTSADGEEEIPSEIWAFKIRDLAGSTSSGPSLEAILNALGLIPGLDLVLEGLFEEGGELEGFTPTSINLDGRNATLGELAAYIAQLNQEGRDSFNVRIDDAP